MTDEAAICREYEAGDSLRTLARRHGASTTAIQKILIKHDVPRRPQNGKPAKIVSSAERLARVIEVSKLLVKRIDRHAIFKYVNETLEWNIRPITCDQYMVAARKLLADQYRDDLEELRHLFDATDRYLLSSAIAACDLKLAHEINKDMKKTRGVYAPAKTELTGKDGADLAGVVIYLPDNNRDRTDGD